MPAPASLAIKAFFILSRLCEARASPQRHLSVARGVRATSSRLAAPFVNPIGRVKLGIPAPVRPVELQHCRIPGSEGISRERAGEEGRRCHCWVSQKHHVPVGRGRWSPRPVLGVLPPSPPCHNSAPTDGEWGKLQTQVKKLPSHTTGKGKLHLRLCKEIRRNFITEMNVPCGHCAHSLSEAFLSPFTEESLQRIKWHKYFKI